MKGAVSNHFHLRFLHKPELSKDPVVLELIKSYHQRPVVKKTLDLKYTHSEYKSALRTQPPPQQLRTRILHGRTINLLLSFSGLRTTEAAQLDREATNPSLDGRTWRFNSLIKQHNAIEEIVVHRQDKSYLDHIVHLLEVRRRARLAGPTSCSFWIRDDGTELSGQCMGTAAEAALQEVNIDEPNSTTSSTWLQQTSLTRAWHFIRSAASFIISKAPMPS
jgi:hypothetical protein